METTLQHCPLRAALVGWIVSGSHVRHLIGSLERPLRCPPALRPPSLCRALTLLPSWSFSSSPLASGPIGWLCFLGEIKAGSDVMFDDITSHVQGEQISGSFEEARHSCRPRPRPSRPTAATTLYWCRLGRPSWSV